MIQSPLISVIMSVHNGAQFLSLSIESILKQTISDFEFLIVDDGSTDSSCDVIEQYAAMDARIIWWRREQKGLTKSLNEMLGRSRGAFIVRQDADDISLPHRLQTMVEFLKENPSIAAAGSWCERINFAGQAIGTFNFPIDHIRISWGMIGGTCILHPSSVMRRECFLQYGFYNEEYIYSQDYELWTRWIQLGAQLANVPQILVKYRISDLQISTRFFGPQSKFAVNVATIYINYLLSDRLESREILGVRQLFGGWPMDADAACGIPVLLRLLKLPRFKPWIYYAWSTRSALATNIVKAMYKFGGPGRKQARAALLVAPLISPRVILERNWWAILRRQISSSNYNRR